MFFYSTRVCAVHAHRYECVNSKAKHLFFTTKKGRARKNTAAFISKLFIGEPF